MPNLNWKDNVKNRMFKNNGSQTFYPFQVKELIEYPLIDNDRLNNGKIKKEVEKYQRNEKPSKYSSNCLIQ